MQEGRGRWQRQDDLRIMISYRASKVAARLRLEIELALEIAAHLALHLVDLAEGEHALAHDAPGFVGVGVVTDDLGGNHER